MPGLPADKQFSRPQNNQWPEYDIYPDKYPFLNKKYRFIDCYILREIKKERIIEEAEYIACLDDNDMDKVRQLLRSSPIIDKSTIEQYGL